MHGHRHVAPGAQAGHQEVVPAAASMAAGIVVTTRQRGARLALDGHVMIRALVRERRHPHAGMQIWVIPAGRLVLHSRTATLNGAARAPLSLHLHCKQQSAGPGSVVLTR